MSFKALNLHPKILQSIEEMGYEMPTAIQEQAIPEILEGCDLAASAQTGTGKTAAFILPILDKLLNTSSSSGKDPRVLILVPTRELAMQVSAETVKYSKHTTLKTVCIFGGVPYPIQNKKLAKPYDILIATPGRLMDLLQRRKISLSKIETLVLDEADRMLDMGFIEPVEEIAEQTPEERQTLLFSATLKKSVLRLAKKLLRNPTEIAITPDSSQHLAIEQRLHYVDGIEHKHQLLDHILREDAVNYAIVFTATKVLAEQLVDKLYDEGHQAAALHGDMNQRQRTRVIRNMHRGQIKVLVATDVAARGIDIDSISHVINFDLPNNVEDYVHRIGRTGRAGASGIALSFAKFNDKKMVERIESFTGNPITLHVIPGMEPVQKPSSRGNRPARRKPSSRFSRQGFGSRRNERSSESEGRKPSSRFSKQGFGSRRDERSTESEGRKPSSRFSKQGFGSRRDERSTESEGRKPSSRFSKQGFGSRRDERSTEAEGRKPSSRFSKQGFGSRRDERSTEAEGRKPSNSRFRPKRAFGKTAQPFSKKKKRRSGQKVFA